VSPSRKRVFSFLAVAVCAAALTGCVVPVEPRGFLSNYAVLQKVEGADFSVSKEKSPALGAGDAMTTSVPALIAVNIVGWARLHPGPNAELALGAEKDLEASCYRALLRQFPSPTIVTRESDLTHYRRALSPAYRLEIAVTEAEPGNGPLRYFVGFYAGAATIQAEFHLREARTNRLVASFATRRIHPGYAHNGLNPMVMSAPRVLRTASDEIAGDLAPLLSEMIKPSASTTNKH
jgi:hypothetical protein